MRRKRRNIKKTIFEKVTCKLCCVIYATSPYICEPSSKHLLLFALPVSLQEFKTAQTENIISNHIWIENHFVIDRVWKSANIQVDKQKWKFAKVVSQSF